MATSPEKIQIRLDTAMDTGATAKSLAEIKKAIKELKGLAAELGPEGGLAFEEATRAAAELQDRIDDVNDSLKAVKGDSIEQLGGSFGLLKDGLFSLDFDKATSGAKAFTKTIQDFNVTDIKKKFGDFKKSVGDISTAIGDKFGKKSAEGVNELSKATDGAGKSFKSFNTILKLSFIGVIVGLVILLITKFDELKESGGVVGKVFQFISDKISILTNGFSKLLDFFSLTNAAGQKNADEQIKNNEKLTESMQKRYEREIALAEAAGKDVKDLQEQKLKDELSFIEKSIDALQKLKNEDGKLSEERQKQLDEFESAYADHVNQLNIISAKRNLFDVQAGEKSADRQKKLNIELMGSDKERSIAKIKLAGEEQKILIQKDIDEVSRNLLKYKAEVELEQKRVNLFGAFDDILKQQRVKALQDSVNTATNTLETLQTEIQLTEKLINKQIGDINSTAQKKITDKNKSEADKRAKDAEAVTDKYLLDERKKLIKAQEEELKNLKKGSADYIAVKAAQKIALDKFDADAEFKLLESRKNILDILEKFAIDETELNRRINDEKIKNEKLTQEQLLKLVTDGLDKEKKAKEKALDEEKKAKEKANELEKIKNDTKNQSLLNAFSKLNDLQFGKKKALIDEQNKLDKAELDKQQATLYDNYTSQQKVLEENLANNLISDKKYNEDKLKLDEEYRVKSNEITTKKNAIDIASEKMTTDERVKQINYIAQIGTQVNSALQSLSDTLLQNQTKGLKKGSAEELKAQKAAFKRSKALALVQAGINGAQAIATITAQYPKFDGGFAMVAALTAAATSIATQVAAIKAKQFNPEGGDSGSVGSGAAAGSALSGSASAGSISAPTLFNLGKGPNISPSDSRVYLVESDVTDIQRKVDAIQSGTFLTRKR